MGNSFGFHKSLNVFIQTQKPYYNSGSSIQGTVFVQVKDNCQFSALYLRIQGKQSCKKGVQQCQWFQGSSLNRRKYTGTQKFYIVQHILHKFQGNYLQQGKHAYPFSLQLSDNIPGSFESSEHNAKIQYNLIAYFANYSKDSTVTFQKPIMIREPFRQQVVRYEGQQQSPQGASYGDVKLNVEFDRNVAYEGEDIHIKVHVNNEKGKNDINRVITQLIQYTFVSSNGNASRTYRKPVIKDTKNQTTKKGRNKEIQFSFKIPRVKYQTSISTLVANYYRLEVSIDCAGGLSQDLSIYAPIFILKPNLENKAQNEKHQLGDDWIQHKAVCIRSGQYFFRKNRNLEICNFKNQDLITQSVYGSENPFV